MGSFCRLARVSIVAGGGLGFSLVVLSSSVGYRYIIYSTNTSIITTRSTVEIVPVATYLNPDTQKLAILYENKNKAGGI